MFLILAALAFFTGIALRYQKETGGSLIQAIRDAAVRPPRQHRRSRPRLG